MAPPICPALRRRTDRGCGRHLQAPGAALARKGRSGRRRGAPHGVRDPLRTPATDLPDDAALPGIVAMRALGVTRALGLARALLALGLEDAPVAMHLVGYSPGERATLEVRVGQRRLAVQAQGRGARARVAGPVHTAGHAGGAGSDPQAARCNRRPSFMTP